MKKFLALVTVLVLLAATGVAAVVAAPPAPDGDYFFGFLKPNGSDASPYNSENRFYASARLSSTDYAVAVFFVPDKCKNVLGGAVGAYNPSASPVTVQYDIKRSAGTPDSPVIDDSLVNQSATIPAQTVSELDISGVLTGVSGGQWIGLRFESDVNFIYALGVRLRCKT